jgi:hypothetical protein
LYVEPYDSPGAGVSVATVLPPDMAAPEMPRHVAKPSVETWTLPAQAPELVTNDRDAGVMAVLKVIAIVDVTATAVAPSAGLVTRTAGWGTHRPAASQRVPVPWLHAVPAGRSGCEATPAVQISLVHWLPSSAGTSVSSAALTMLPAPSHWLFWQSPAVWVLVAVPAGGSLAPQVLPAQVIV